MSINVLRGQLQMCADLMATTQAMLVTTIRTLDEVAAENNAKPQESKDEGVRKTFGGSRRRETANGAAA